ncbi:hypothetical protein PYW07_017431 [Mythimna separata]|uniref:beta-fructofuranosidase n=1 Tax=Mythimna separata TaxID=271217 RepID=A0AAD7YWP6_MYTSE|nr:hypothetical protein PYW07_017431 [Mythimna separata]
MKDSVDNYVDEQQREIQDNLNNYVDDIQVTAKNLVNPVAYNRGVDTFSMLLENPDIVLSVPGIITRNGYICETHTVISQGYVLNIHRIPRSKHGKRVPKKTVLLQHGLFASSADWIINGPGKGLAYVLADAGYDVWMSNIRGNRYSKDHVWYKTDSQAYWDFSWHEVAMYDVPAVIDYILETKGLNTKITYIGHSMGTTILFAMLTLKPEYNNILSAGFALAPVVYLSDMKSPLKSMAPIASNLAYLDGLQGTYEFIPKNSALGKISSTCNGENMDSLICKNIVFYLCGFNERQFNKTLLPVFLAHLGTGTSWKTAVHFSQEILSGKFQKYDYGYLNNWSIYGTTSPPEYDLTITSTMAVLKLFVVLLSLFVTAQACDLTETDADKTAKAAVETNITNNRPFVISNSRYRQVYHVSPPVGWMNDPNGFSFFKDKYHLFYQFYPYDTSTGNIHWAHVTSPDLVAWTQEPIALLPGDEQIFSGSAIEKDGTLVLMYTAHKTEKINDTFSLANETQYLAFSNDGVVFNKYKNNPVISFTPDNSRDFRDPKVWKHENYYYVVMGTQTANKLGKVLLYRSLDLGFWEYFNEIGQPQNVTSNTIGGYMWECPDFFELSGRFILLMSPQGMAEVGDRYHNQFQTGYIIGNFDYTTGKFTETASFQEIDYGHDFYATQTMEKDGKRYLIAWMGSWDGQFQERPDGWAGSMTIIRELTLVGDRILMKPVDAITNLRDGQANNITLEQNGVIDTLNKSGELIVTFDLTQNLSLKFQGASDTQSVVTLGWDSIAKKVSLDRNYNATTPTNVRQGEWNPINSTSLRIFLDSSSIEVFCGEGEVVFSSRVYPTGAWRVSNLAAQSVSVSVYNLKRSVAI